ncbi:MAG: hypothetical protein Q9213_005586 [Squamulea squamosa]
MIYLWITTLALLLRLFPPSIAQEVALVPRSTSPPGLSPISVDPSQYWYDLPLPPKRENKWTIADLLHREGDDGPWSSFTLRVGTPAQDVRTFVSTSSQVSWIVLQGQGCRPNDGVCAEARGKLYNMNASSTWRPNGFWQLGYERNLGIYANGLYGNDTIGLGIQGSGGPTLTDQIMAVIGTQQVYVGMFAVNPKRTNYTGITEQGQASYMTNLKNQSLIPSLSFGYTAGAPYRLKKVLGSLTLGGYDQSRFTPNNMTFSFAPDIDRDIVVGIQSIVSTDRDGSTHDLLPTGINAYVDSTVPQIWLPLEACKEFEMAFGLEYDSENQLYPVNNTLHTKLVAQNASITFRLGDSDLGGQSIDITLPYDSFDLQAKPPFSANATRYFPLQRAANESQYTLGRTFLQEAYLTVDWERQNFSISQCSFDPNISQQKLVSIHSVQNATTVTERQGATSNGTIIGIAIGVAVAVVLIVGGIAAFFIIQKRKRKRQRAEATTEGSDEEAEKIRQGFAKAELDTDSDHARYEMGDPKADLYAQTPQDSTNGEVKHPASHAELMGDQTAEMSGSGQLVPELSSYKGFSGPFHEMHDPSAPPVELPATLPQELPASPLPTASPSSNSSSMIFRSANESSPVHEPSRRQHTSRHRPAQRPKLAPSGVESERSHSSAPSSSAQVSRGPSSPEWSGASSPREQGPFSPISPVGGTWR